MNSEERLSFNPDLQGGSQNSPEHQSSTHVNKSRLSPFAIGGTVFHLPASCPGLVPPSLTAGQRFAGGAMENDLQASSQIQGDVQALGG